MGEMEYKEILGRSFSQYEQKKIGHGAIISCFIIALTSFTLFKSSFSHLPTSNLQFSIDTGLRMLMVDDTSHPAQQLIADSEMKQEIKVADIEMKQKIKIPDQEMKQEIKVADINETKVIADSEMKQEIKVADINETKVIADSEIMKQEIKVADMNETKVIADSEMKQKIKIPDNEMKQEIKVADNIEMVKNETKVRDMEMKQEIKVADSKMKQEIKLPVCNLLDERSDFCEIDGDIRIHGKSSTVLFASSQNGNFAENETWRIKPYPRKVDKVAMASVNELSVKSFSKNDKEAPFCTLNHKVPAIIFSLGGYCGNHFHAYTDVLVPLFLTSHQFHQQVQFLVTNSNPYWISKYETILKHLSNYPIIEIDNQVNVHCYRRVIVGLKFHEDLGIDSLKSPKGYSMKDFTQFLRSSYSLKRSSAIKIGKSGRKTKKIPRLLIVSRKRTRKFTNEAEIANMARSLGYEVIVEEPGGFAMSYSRSAQIVNSCDVMMGVHGAGLTNLVFLPRNAVVIQIIPLGGLEGLSRHDFGEPTKEMKLRYLEYKIREEESSLIEKYPLNHDVFKDPLSIGRQGWDAIKFVYLDNQDVKLDVGRLRGTLLKALELLHH